MEYKVQVDEAKKIVSMEMNGNPSLQEMKSFLDEIKQKTAKFKPQEAKVLCNANNTSVMAPEIVEVMKEVQVLYKNFSKVATIGSSVLLSMQAKKAGTETGVSNRQFFKTEEEAMAWLME